MRRFAPALLLLGLPACGSETQAPEPPPDPTGAGAALEKSAIARGVIPDPESIELEGRFERRSDLGTDKFCAVRAGDDRYRIGILASFGPGSTCEGQGEARPDGDGFALRFEEAEGCELHASFDGDELRIDGAVPEACSALCDSRASLAGTSYYLVEPGAKAARRTVGAQVERLCG
ncbi:hypothetical protein [Novosphingopyxis iocasae]|uniref:hypothetical protein n=1 Tax=Novosphingopyxis iocasae TaxID=2762729 RepID=UPI00165187EA|nr:hypothetical protein [Novosphingopyxis iocasae]